MAKKKGGKLGRPKGAPGGKAPRAGKDFLEKLGPVPEELSNLKHTADFQYVVDRVFEYIMAGKHRADILTLILAERKETTREQFAEYYDAALERAEMQIHRDRDYVFALHLDRYERIYEETIKLENKWGFKFDPNKEVLRIANAYKDALRSLKCKEDLIGLHNRKMVLELDGDRAFMVDEETKAGGPGKLAGYDLSKLSIIELKELLSLIQETRTVPETGIQRVVIKQRTVIEINGNLSVGKIVKNIDDIHPVEDIGYEEMPEKVIHRVQDITPPEPEPEVIKEVIEDLVPKGIEKKEAKDVIDQIQKNQIEELKRKMKGL